MSNLNLILKPNTPLCVNYNYKLPKSYPRHLTTDNNNFQISKRYYLKLPMNTILADAKYAGGKKMQIIKLFVQTK